MNRWSLFRERKGLWLPALLFLVLNLAGLIVYRVQFAGQSVFLERQLATRQDQLAAAKAEHARLASLVERARTNRGLVASLYQDRFGLRSHKLTQVTEEVKDLAMRAGLEPRSIRYPEAELEAYGLTQRSFQFSVEGTYPALRTFLNFLELSPSFLTIEQVSVRESGKIEGALALDVVISTFFAQEGSETAAAGERP
ncbi:MAG: GspMb/PilO family protein [Thermoanaerobaculia bacterium]